ncbi:threonine synthase [Algihabitans albus]|uniref:threonine synthase n=1 Tax=Algihabitans albus TaxID=2164067 RepID=UPI000E5CAC39|nr:threonine synthase [Algihabitans albus]
MRYRSTRGTAPTLGFDDVLLTGLARDGGLYLPESWPQVSAETLRALRGKSYAELATAVMQPFVAGSVIERDFARIVADTYATFDHAAVTPLKQLDADLWLLELFHGPTLAFKDVALQLLGRLFDAVLARRQRRLTIVGATSGDTGSAALEACRDRDNLDIFVLFPKGRTSEVQRRQMTTIAAPNAHAIAVEGSFDDCQDLVKALFADEAFRDEFGLSAVNSINWARIMAQIVYYFAAALALGAPDRRIGFSVPTGNFGNVYAAYAARQMGLPVARLLVASNRNDILARFFEGGEMRIGAVEPSLSPSMDIQVSSNFERLLFDLTGGNGAEVAGLMTAFRRDGTYRLTAQRMAQVVEIFRGFRLDDPATISEIRNTHAATGEILDPHSAVGLGAARALAEPGSATVSLACAHPAKFPDAVEQATGVRPSLPDRLSDLYDRPERMSELPNDLNALRDYVRAHAKGLTVV